jgi:hypothetical protein
MLNDTQLMTVQHLQVLVGAVLGLSGVVVLIAYVLKRRPLLFVADKLPGNLYGGADDVSDFVDGEIEAELGRESLGGDVTAAEESVGDPAGGLDREKDNR